VFPILRFGTIRFLLAHAYLFISEAGLIERINVNRLGVGRLGVKQPRLTTALGGTKADHRGEAG
jgi:hypothetical protein